MTIRKEERDALTMISHGGEISIARGVEEIVRAYLWVGFIIFFNFLIFYISHDSLLRYKNSHAALAMM